MKMVYVVVEVPDDMQPEIAENALLTGLARIGVTASTTSFEDVVDLIDWAGVDVVEMARDAMRGSR